MFEAAAPPVLPDAAGPDAKTKPNQDRHQGGKPYEATRFLFKAI
jgi:hypothetical protein